jgi:hypothetical protein
VVVESITAGFGLAVAVTLAVSVAANLLSRGEHWPEIAASLLLTFGFLATNFLLLALPMQEATRAYPVIDAFSGLVMWCLFLQQRAAWKGVVFALLFVQGLRHITFQSRGDFSDAAVYLYHLELNVMFGIQLLAVLSSGARNVGDRLGRGLLALLGRRSAPAYVSQREKAR